MTSSMFESFISMFKELRETKRKEFARVLPMGDYFSDRWEKARYLGFGTKTSIYDSSYVFGDVQVGENTWIGPNTLLDGSGGLVIGSFCSISTGVQIYTHDTVKWALSGGEEGYEYSSTKIGDNTYIGPNTIIEKGVSIGSGVVVGANSFVNRNVPDGAKAYGTPIRISGVD